MQLAISAARALRAQLPIEQAHLLACSCLPDGLRKLLRNRLSLVCLAALVASRQAASGIPGSLGDCSKRKSMPRDVSLFTRKQMGMHDQDP